MNVERLLPADAVRPLWSSASALVYTGGLVVVAATVALITIVDDGGGAWAVTGAALVAAAIAFVLAEALARAERAIAAGVAATIAVVFAAVAAGGLLDAVGALDTALEDYEPSIIPVSGVVLAGAALAIRRYRAPLPVLLIALTVWGNIAELSSLADVDNGGEVLSIAAGALLVAAGIVVDRADRRPFGFGLHVVGGLAAGGAVVSLAGDSGWAVIAAASLGYLAVSFVLERSSYAALGAIGVLIATTMFVTDPVDVAFGLLPFGEPTGGDSLADWQIALSYLVAGILLGAVGVAGRLWRVRGAGPADG